MNPHIKNIIRDLVPPAILKLRQQLKKGKSGTLDKNNSFVCPVCNSRINAFKRLGDYFFESLDNYQYVHSIFLDETLNILQYQCPVCGCSDRDRLYALYLSKKFDLPKKTNKLIRFLDIAPVPSLAQYIRKNSCINYRSVDLFNDLADDKADITDMNIYENDSFDFILCSHVLEHVPEDRKALAEIFRILRPQGSAIIMAPILLSLDQDLENESYTSESDRWKYFGQNDHVRIYSKNGFIAKLQEAGFDVEQLGVDFFGIETFKKYGIHARSVLYIANKLSH